MSTRPPRVALFDLGGVLFTYTPAIRWQRFAELTDIEHRFRDSPTLKLCLTDQGLV